MSLRTPKNLTAADRNRTVYPLQKSGSLDGAHVVYNAEKNGIEIHVPQRPTDAQLAILRDDHGVNGESFRYHRSKNFWYGRDSVARRNIVTALGLSLPAELRSGSAPATQSLPVSAPTPTDKPKRHRRTKAEMQAARAALAQEPAAVTATIAATASAPSSVIDTLAEKLADKLQSQLMNRAFEILAARLG